jgi:hypothetical protein
VRQQDLSAALAATSLAAGQAAGEQSTSTVPSGPGGGQTVQTVHAEVHQAGSDEGAESVEHRPPEEASSGHPKRQDPRLLPRRSPLLVPPGLESSSHVEELREAARARARDEIRDNRLLDQVQVMLDRFKQQWSDGSVPHLVPPVVPAPVPPGEEEPQEEWSPMSSGQNRQTADAVLERVEVRAMEERMVGVTQEERQVSAGDALGRLPQAPHKPRATFMPMAEDHASFLQSLAGSHGVLAWTDVSAAPRDRCRLDPEGWAAVASRRQPDDLLVSLLERERAVRSSHVPGRPPVHSLKDYSAREADDRLHRLSTLAATQSRLVSGSMTALSSCVLDARGLQATSFTDSDGEPFETQDVVDMVKKAATDCLEGLTYAQTFLGDALDMMGRLQDYVVRKRRRLWLAPLKLNEGIQQRLVESKVPLGKARSDGSVQVPLLFGDALKAQFAADKEAQAVRDAVQLPHGPRFHPSPAASGGSMGPPKSKKARKSRRDAPVQAPLSPPSHSRGGGGSGRGRGQPQQGRRQHQPRGRGGRGRSKRRGKGRGSPKDQQGV